MIWGPESVFFVCLTWFCSSVLIPPFAVGWALTYEVVLTQSFLIRVKECQSVRSCWNFHCFKMLINWNCLRVCVCAWQKKFRQSSPTTEDGRTQDKTEKSAEAEDAESGKRLICGIEIFLYPPSPSDFLRWKYWHIFCMYRPAYIFAEEVLCSVWYSLGCIDE